MRGLQRTIAAAAATCLILGLAGCAPTSDYSPEVSERIQERVLGATTAAASGDYSTLLGRLDALEVDLRDALARGHITQARYESISAAIAHVRSDTEAAIAAQQPAPAPVPEPAPQPPAKEKPDKGKPDKDNPGKDNPGKDKKGPGNNPGKDKGD